MFLSFRYNAEAVRVFGPEIAAARFAVGMGGKVKFHGVDRLFSPSEMRKNMFPSRFIQTVTVEEVDLSETTVIYEGFDNLRKFAV